ncbi:MAG: hypothetical protein IKS78_06840, partial [Clostridia bacterium]|nr:hypothetical protein [Clostridia bacterium]
MTVILVAVISDGSLVAKGPWAVVGHGALMMAVQIGVGLVIGLLVGYGAKWLLGKIQTSNFALAAILIISIAFFANGVASAFSGNGLLASYVTAIVIGNKATLQSRKDILKFFDGLTWLMQMIMFMMLGLLAHPSQMGHLILQALILFVFMVLVSRPLSVFISTLPFKGLSFRARTFVSWVGIKGAGPILFALYTMVSGVEYADDTFNFSVRHFTQELLDKAAHEEDLRDMGITLLSLDGVTRGIGSSSCGPDTREEYRLNALKGYAFSFTVIPKI